MSAPINLPDRRPRDGNAEARIQASIVEYVRLVAPGVLIFAIPNGGLRSKAEAARMKWTGTLAGVPDLAIVAPGGRVFFIEVKSPGGTLSPDQRAIRDWLVALGSPPAICRSIDDARRAFLAWGIETSEARNGRP
jgi:VRR-NUC domain